MPVKPLKPDKLYYSIGEVSAMLDVNTSLIRYWEKEFSALKPRKNSSGTRHFSQKDIDQLRYIYHLVKIEGHTLEGAKKILKQKETEEAARFSSLNSLEKIRGFLVALREEIS